MTPPEPFPEWDDLIHLSPLALERAREYAEARDRPAPAKVEKPKTKKKGRVAP